MPDVTHVGRVHWNDFSPAAGVRVRIFDRDASSADNDLTVTEGISDGDGYFRVVYNPDRYQDLVPVSTRVAETVCDSGRDPLTGATIPVNCRIVWRTVTEMVPDPQDVFAPYLRCSYNVNNEHRQATFALLPAPIRLPETPAQPPGGFQPATDGFRFVNRFTGTVTLPFPVGGTQTISRTYGLCGGMSAAAIDFWRDPLRRIPETDVVPAAGSPLHQYLVQRQIDSFGVNGEAAARFPDWMELPDNGSNGIREHTRNEFAHLRNMFNQGAGAVPLGLVYMGPGALAANPESVFNNHQVVAVGVRGTLSDTQMTIRIYDPNFPNNNSVEIRCQQVVVAVLQPPPIPRLRGLPPALTPPPIFVMGLQCTQDPPPSVAGFPNANVRGFFVMPYVFKSPPPGL